LSVAFRNSFNKFRAFIFSSSQPFEFGVRFIFAEPRYSRLSRMRVKFYGLSDCKNKPSLSMVAALQHMAECRFKPSPIHMYTSQKKH